MSAMFGTTVLMPLPLPSILVRRRGMLTKNHELVRTSWE